MELDFDIDELNLKFSKWENAVKDNLDLSLEQAIKSFEECGISITRLLIPNQRYPNKFYRARIISADSAEDLSDPNTYSYPPVKFTSDFQRANVPGHPVFYGALDAHTAIEEIRKNGVKPIEKGDVIFLAEWKLKDGCDITLKYLTLPEIIEEDQLYSILTKKVYNELENLFGAKGEHHVKYQVALFEKISRLFLGRNYHQSSIIAYDVMFMTPKVEGIRIDGIIYPSCSNGFRSVNCALKPEFVDDNLELVQVSKLKFNQFSNSGAEVSNTYSGENKNGSVIWTHKVSELVFDDCEVTYITDLQWDKEKTTKALFFHNSVVTDIEDFCKLQFQAIEKVQEIKGRESNPIDPSKTMACMYDITMDSKTTYLKSGHEINSIYRIQLVIPLKTYIQEIFPVQVLKDNLQIPTLRYDVL